MLGESLGEEVQGGACGRVDKMTEESGRLGREETWGRKEVEVDVADCVACGVFLI